MHSFNLCLMLGWKCMWYCIQQMNVAQNFHFMILPKEYISEETDCRHCRLVGQELYESDDEHNAAFHPQTTCIIDITCLSIISLYRTCWWVRTMLSHLRSLCKMLYLLCKCHRSQLSQPCPAHHIACPDFSGTCAVMEERIMDNWTLVLGIL